MHMFGSTGVLLLAAGLMALTASLVSKMLTPGEPFGPALVAGLILTVSGLQLVAFGVIAELQVRTYFESQGKKPYRVRRIYNPGVLVS